MEEFEEEKIIKVIAVGIFLILALNITLLGIVLNNESGTVTGASVQQEEITTSSMVMSSENAEKADLKKCCDLPDMGEDQGCYVSGSSCSSCASLC